jgi:hypothetical protein
MVRRSLAGAVAPVRARFVRGERMRPGYLVVGTKRGGSTSLAEWIEQHPEVGVCRSRKGTHYFDVNFGRGWRWYLSQFPRTSEGYRITGESSPYYMFHPLAAPRIAAALPDVKIVMCLRDPVARAWSHHTYEYARGNETVPFEQALGLEPSRLNGERERLASDPAYRSDEWRYHAYLQRGHYADQLQTFYERFPPEQVLVVQSEALFADPIGQLGRVFAFLGLSPFVPTGLEARNANRPYGEMAPETVERLQNYYAPLNEKLYAMPGIDFQWDYSSVTSHNAQEPVNTTSVNTRATAVAAEE